MSSEKRLFIIDDEPLLLTLLKEYLEGYDLTVFVYESIPDLEKELKEKSPQAVLLDILMPHVSGIDVLKKIKGIDSRIPVIMMTGYADDAKRIESLRSGAYTLLSKPFKNLEELYHTVNNAMSHYAESLRTQELGAEVEERYKRERINLLELDFLRNLQHMIGETEDPESVISNSYSLLKNFLTFNYFAAALQRNDILSVRIYPLQADSEDLQERIRSVLLAGNRSRGVSDEGNVGFRGSVEKTSYAADDVAHAVIVELSTANKVYGQAGLFRRTPFEVQEEHIFGRFASHIALTLEKIELFNEVKILSIKDGLTGVYNHVYVMGALEAEIERVKRYDLPLSLILVDIDNFKKVNDTYGHLAGDSVLEGVSRTIVGTLRAIEIVGRYGGEEFLIILPETDIKEAIVAGERLRLAIESEGFSAENTPIPITVSAGIASYAEGTSARDLMKIADDNLYKAKAGGKNRIAYE